MRIESGRLVNLKGKMNRVELRVEETVSDNTLVSITASRTKARQQSTASAQAHEYNLCRYISHSIQSSRALQILCKYEPGAKQTRRRDPPPFGRYNFTVPTVLLLYQHYSFNDTALACTI